MYAFDILSSVFILVCSLFGVIFAFLFIAIIFLHRQCRTMAILLVLNSIVAGFIANITCVCQAIYQIMNVGDDILCPIRGFFLHSGTAFIYHTLCIQAFHRLFVTVFAAKRYLQSTRVIVSVVIVQWFISITFNVPILLKGSIIYQADSRICQVSFDDIFSFIYDSLIIYGLPLQIIILIYIQVVRYIKRHSFTTISGKSIIERKRQKREIFLIRRIVMLVLILYIMGCPYGMFFTLNLIGKISPPPYALRISYMFLAFGQGISMLFFLIETDDVKKRLITMIRRKQRNKVECILPVKVPIQQNSMATVQRERF